jgi:hypothetical protein
VARERVKRVWHISDTTWLTEGPGDSLRREPVHAARGHGAAGTRLTEEHRAGPVCAGRAAAPGDQRRRRRDPSPVPGPARGEEAWALFEFAFA